MKWSKKEIDNLLEFIKLGKSYKEISEIINRTEGSIRSKAFRFDEKSSVYYKPKEVVGECLNCDSEFIDLVSRNRRFCSQSCNAKYHNRIRIYESGITNKCFCCGDDLENKKNKYCNRVCENLYNQNIVFKKIENGDTTLYERNYKKYLIYKYGEKCMECGWCEVHSITGNVPIQMEHIDGHSENNKLDNLKLLCPNCHSLTSTYGFLNKGNGRKKRYKKVEI